MKKDVRMQQRHCRPKYGNATSWKTYAGRPVVGHLILTQKCKFKLT